MNECPPSIRRTRCAVIGVLILAQAAEAVWAQSPSLPHLGHVFIIVLENEGYDITFSPKSPARYLRKIANQGALLTNYFAIGHFSLDNYIAMVSGQAPNPATQNDCPIFEQFRQTGTAAYGQAIGSGCVYPAAVSTLPGQLEQMGFSWKAYMEDMGNDPRRDKGFACAHPSIGLPDDTLDAALGDQYAMRHNPFVYFHGIIDRPTCATHVVNLRQLGPDLESLETTPNYAFISPNLCHDGHDGGQGSTCVNGEPGGLLSADQFLAEVVPRILNSLAFRKDGLLIITFDESDVEASSDPNTKQQLISTDATACCGELPGPNIDRTLKLFGDTTDDGPGIIGPGGGRVGAVLLSPLITPGTISKQPYNHYSLLRSVEDVFRLDHLGYAGQAGLRSFGTDIFNARHKDGRRL